MAPAFAPHPILSWDDDLALGVDAIDEEHKVWLRLVRGFQQSIADGEAPAAVYAAIVEALIYTERHFANEEALMRDAGYPHLDDHRAQHARAADELHAVTSGLHDEAELIAYVGSFLPNWLLLHINTADRKFADWLNARETGAAA
ncbi:MAG TPA: bacteriohemerythrin [Azospirillum sp.]